MTLQPESTPNALVQSAIDARSKSEGIERAVADLQIEARRLRGLYQDNEFFRDNLFVLEELERAAPGFDLMVRRAKSATGDRRASMLTGPFFSSETCPWPFSGDSPMAPVVQIDLRVPSIIKGLDFGDGLLQVFSAVDGGEWIVRVVPRSVVENESPDPVPKMEMEQGSVASLDWASDGGEFDEIVGLGEPFFSSMTRCDLSWVPDDFPLEVKEFCERVDAVSGHSYGPTRLFGSFDFIQYLPSERPFCLVCIDSVDCRFKWGVDGSAQVFYEFEDGVPKFSFEWAC